MIEENEVVQDVEVSAPVDSAGSDVPDTPDSVLDNPEAVGVSDGTPEDVEDEYLLAEDDEEYFNFAEMAEEQVIEDARLFFETPFESYTVTEGLLLLIFIVLFLKTLLGLARG